MAMTSEQKRKAKKALFRMSTPQEQAELSAIEMIETQDKIDRLMEAVSDGSSQRQLNEMLKSLSDSMHKMHSSTLGQSKQFAEAFKEMQTASLKSVKAMQEELIKHSSEINANAGPVYKTMINHLAGMRDSFANWKYPQYAAVSVRNKNFANINPAISPFGIEDYDEIDITYSGSNPTVVVYKLNGNTMGTLTLTYSGSNITKVVRT